MKKRIAKRILAFALALAMLVSLVPAAFAAEEPAYDHNCPYIFVPGFMATDIFVDPDDPDSELAWPPSGDAIWGAVKASLPSIIKTLFTRDYDKLAREITPNVNEIFAPILNAPDGTVQNSSGPRFTYPDAETVTAESNLSFRYDWRIDPIEVAAQLNDFINFVLEASGCDEVVLECHSYGGVITTTYAKLYGTEKVRSFFYNSTAVFGETYNGELMTGNLCLDSDAITEYLKSAFNYNDNEKLLNGLFAFLKITGITGAVCRLGNKLVSKMLDYVAENCVVPLFGGWLSIWAMVPDEYIDDAMDYVFNELYKDSPIDRSGLKAKIDDYNTRIRPYKAETLRTINETSNLYVCARYGFCSLFMTPSWRNASDNTIDVKYASFGATAADYGSKLPDSVINGAKAEYISPDKTVNAEGAMFPEQTWYIRNLTHAYSCRGYDEMIKALLYYDGQATVETFEEYPRFMYYDEADDVLPDSQQALTLTFAEKASEFFRGLFK